MSCPLSVQSNKVLPFIDDRKFSFLEQTLFFFSYPKSMFGDGKKPNQHRFPIWGKVHPGAYQVLAYVTCARQQKQEKIQTLKNKTKNDSLKLVRAQNTRNKYSGGKLSFLFLPISKKEIMCVYLWDYQDSHVPIGHVQATKYCFWYSLNGHGCFFQFLWLQVRGQDLASKGTFHRQWLGFW